MKLRQIHEGWGSTVGHAALDVAGFVPGIGEGADFANVLWYLREKEYFAAAMSLLSMLPEVGDVIGKSVKYLGRGSQRIAAFIARYGDEIAKYWGKALKLAEQAQQLRPYAALLDRAVR